MNLAFGVFNSSRSAAKAGRVTLPATKPGERIYAIGDIHGRFDLLRDLLDRIETHAGAMPPAQSVHVVLLGDMIDRGPDSAKVLDLVRKLQQQTDQLIVLLGNHEELLLGTLEGRAGIVRAWIRAGGDATLTSLGIAVPEPGVDPRAFAGHLAAKLPKELVGWLRQLPLTARSGDYLFCHAGIRPAVAMKRQTRADLLWIRDEFLMDDVTDHGAVIVHGHSVSEEIEVRPYRIGIDTGAYRSGLLTALYLEGTERQTISANGIFDVPPH